MMHCGVSVDLFRLLVWSVRDYAIFLLDTRGHVATWNLGAERIKGYTADEIIGRHFSTFYPPEDAGKCPQELETALRDGRFEDEGWRVRKDGGRFWASVVITPVRDDKGRLLGFGKVTRDVTERKRSEDERTQRLAAEAAGRSKDTYLAMLGHELRNPLAPIVAALQVLKLRDDWRSQRELGIIARQVDQIVRLVDDILDVSRITGGKIELKRAHIDLRDVIARAIEAASPLLEDKGQLLRVTAPRHPVVIDADATRLTQVCTNLIANAVKYTGRGGHIVVAVSYDADAATIEVRDDGIGMSAELVDKVFDLFVQGEASSGRAGGLGLGLAITRSLVQQHGGSVTAASPGPGHGSSFTVRLPLAQPSPMMPRAEPTPAPFRAAHTRQPNLIVDDNHHARKLLAEILESLGHDIVTAGTGEAALALVGERVPDVAILDIGLPTMDGYELATRLRETLAHPPLLIALTGYGQPQDRAHGESAGFDRFLIKPIDVRTLIATIDELASTH